MSGMDVAIWCLFVGVIAFCAGLMFGAILVATEDVSWEKAINRGRKNEMSKMLAELDKEIERG